MDSTTGETWRFTTFAGPADEVYLAVDGPTSPSRWIAMQPLADDPGVWRVHTTILPGRHRVRYYTVDKGTTLNCGSQGLVGERTSTPNPRVQIDDMMDLAVSA